MLNALLGVLVFVSPDVSGDAPRASKDRARQLAEEVIAKTRRLSLAESEGLAQYLIFLDLSVDSSAVPWKRTPEGCLAGCIEAAIWETFFGQEPPEEEDTTKLYTYKITAHGRMVDVETGLVVQGFAVEGQASTTLGFSAARELAWEDWEAEMEKAIRKAFRLELRVTASWGTPFGRWVSLDGGQADGVKRGHIYKILREYEAGITRTVGYARVEDVGVDSAKARVLRGVYRVSPGDLAVESVEEGEEFLVFGVVPVDGYAVSRDRLLGEAHGFYLGFRPWVAWPSLRWDFGAEAVGYREAWGGRFSFGPGAYFPLVPELVGVGLGLRLGLGLWSQPIREGVSLRGDPDAVMAVEVGAELGGRGILWMGDRAFVWSEVSAGVWYKSPWFYRAPAESDTSEPEWVVVSPSYTEYGSLDTQGFRWALGLGVRF